MQNFWEIHGWFFILFMFFFPRLTLLFSSVASGGLLWWLGFIFAPRLLVAILATFAYWHTNTILVILSWFWALGLESGEKKLAWRSPVVWKNRKIRRGMVVDTTARRD